MPIVGYIDPRHEERKRGVGGLTGELPKWFTVDELLEQAASADPKWSPYPYELLKAGLDNVEERGDNISTTALVSPCPRSLVLERKADYVESMDRLWRSFRGTAIHLSLERSARPNSIAEVRFFAPLGDDTISCKPDLITPDGVIWDYKNTAKNPVYDYLYNSHRDQLQFNRYIVQNATKWEKDDKPYSLPFDVRSMEFDHLAILYMDIDGPKPLEYTESIEVPTGPKAKNAYKKIKVPTVWSDKQCFDMIKPRYDQLRTALDSYPAFPEGLEEVWGGSADWKCPGWPWCPLKGGCLASRYPDGLIWDKE